MAASLWTIVVVVEETPSSTRAFQMSPDTELFELVQEWDEEFGVFGNWCFKSADKQTIYHDYSITLDMIGESIPNSHTITLKAKLIEEPAPLLFNEIFVNLNEKCHQLFVKPDETIAYLMWCLPERPNCLEFNGEPLNPKQTIMEAGIQHRSFIYEPTRTVGLTVKMSSGYSRMFQMPLESLVWHLMEKVNVFETEEFSLKYEGRYLTPDEGIRHLTKTVEVKRAEFVVHLDGRRITWMTKEEPIAVSDFTRQLLAKSDIDPSRLEELEFLCVGCQRRIRNSKDIQFLPVECCGERSMTLHALAPSETGSNSDRNYLTKDIQVLQEFLERCGVQDPCVEGARCVCRDLKQKLAAEGLDYNVFTRGSRRLLRRISDLEDKIRELNVVVEASEKEIGRFQAENEKIKEDNKELTEDNDKMHEQLSVKLFVWYHPTSSFFSPVPGRPELQSQGHNFIRCKVRELRQGWAAFEEVRDTLRPLFKGPRIGRIQQHRGSVDGRTVALVTSPADDEERVTMEFYCSIDGRESRAREVKEEWQRIEEGGRVLIAGGQRRTVLGILKS